MTNRRRILSTILFYGGLVVSVAGFLGDKAESFPWAMRALAGGYVRAQHGLVTLESGNSLSIGQVGFTELAGLFRSEATKRGVSAAFDSQEVQRFERGTAMIAFGESRAGEVVPVGVVLSSTTVPWDMAGLRSQAETLKQSLLLRFSLVVFFGGLCLTLFGRYLETDRKERRRAGKTRSISFE